MIFGYVENGEMRIYGDMQEALKEWSNYPTDILSNVIIFYSENGNYLEPKPRYGKKRWYEITPKIVSFEFKERTPEKTHQDKLSYLVHHEVTKVKENKFINSLESLKKKINGN